jgi:hypothetical protein
MMLIDALSPKTEVFFEANDSEDENEGEKDA